MVIIMSAELPTDNYPELIEQYNNLLGQRARLDGIEPVDETIAALVRGATDTINAQITVSVERLVPHVVADADIALSALRQLSEIAALGIAGLNPQEKTDTYTLRLHTAARFLVEHGIQDQHAQQIIEAAGMAGPVALSETVAAPASTIEPTDPVRTDSESVPAAQTVLAPEAASPVVTHHEPLRIAVKDAQERLMTYINSLPDGRGELKPRVLWKILAGDDVRDYGDQSTRRALRVLLEDTSIGSLVRSNRKKGRGSLYLIGAANESPELANEDVEISEPEVTAELGDEFNLDTYFSAADALLLAAFLNNFKDLLRDSGIDPISEEHITPLIALLSDEAIDSQPAPEALQEMRSHTLAKIGVLFQRSELLERAVDTIERDDPRLGLFTYLYNILDGKPQNYHALASLLDTKKDYVLQFSTSRRGGEIITVSGVQYVFVGSNGHKTLTRLLSPEVDTTEAGGNAPDGSDEAHGSPVDTEVSDEHTSTPIVDFGEALGEVAERGGGRKAPEHPQLVRAKQIIGSMLDAMIADGVNLEGLHTLGSMSRYMDQPNKTIRTAAEGGYIVSRNRTGSSQSLTVAGVIMAQLTRPGDKRMQNYIGLGKNKSKVSDIIERAIASRLAEIAAQKAEQ